MITLEYGTTRKGLKYIACDELQHDTGAFMYAIGDKPPNYPVPAIRRKHTWFVDNNGLCHAVAIGKRWFPRH